MKEQIKHSILLNIEKSPGFSSKELFLKNSHGISFATFKRILADLKLENLIISEGVGKATKYFISPTFEMLQSISLDQYFKLEVDERVIKANFDFAVFERLEAVELFNAEEKLFLNQLEQQFSENIRGLSEAQKSIELNRLAIDLSWKSSQIEGNTYSLLETEMLLVEKEYAKGKTREEAVMLLNHKAALDFIFDHIDYLNPLTISGIEDIHYLLIQDLGIDKNLRKRRVGISGTKYKPLDNEFEIREALEKTCKLINSKANVYEKALLCLLLISYIQPFVDGNKRTARIISNAILLDFGACPLSFRTVNSLDYKKAMLLFYEKNNISRFKEIFIQQMEFAVNTYF